MPVPAPVSASRSRFLPVWLAWSSLFAECVEEHFAYIDPELRVEFAHASGAGHVDFGELPGDHVQAGELDAVFHQHRPDGARNSQFVVVYGLPLATPAARKVAAKVGAARYTRENIGHRLAVDHENALVAVGDAGQKFLRHRRAASVAGQGLEDYVEVCLVGLGQEYPAPAHSVERLENRAPVFAHEFAQDRRICGN